MMMGWIDGDDVERLSRTSPRRQSSQGVEDWVFHAENGVLTKVTIRVYNPNDDGAGGGADE